MKTERYWKTNEEGKLIPFDGIPYSEIITHELSALEVAGYEAICHGDEKIVEVRKC